MSAFENNKIAAEKEVVAKKQKAELDIVKLSPKSGAPIKLQRYRNNPIIAPSNNPWECSVTTNPGAWYDADTGKVTLLYRAAGKDSDHVIHLGMAVSENGYDFERFDLPVVSPSIDGLDAGCLEDARIVKMGEFYYITYATRVYPPGEYWLNDGQCYKDPRCPDEFPECVKQNHTTTHLLITKDFKKFIRAGRITNPMIDDRDVILFPEKINGNFYMMHRPMEWCGAGYDTDHPAIWIAKSDDLLTFDNSKMLAKAEFSWEQKIGGNTPPIKTPLGWLTLYHGVGYDKQYRLGAMILDLNEPEKVLYRTRKWIFQPETDYETQGFYFGGGVVFPCGKVVIGDTLFVYYGAADKYVGVATCKLDGLLDYLVQCPV